MGKEAESMRGEMQRMPCRILCIAYGVHSVKFRTSSERRIAGTLIRCDAVYHRNKHLIYSQITFMTLLQYLTATQTHQFAALGSLRSAIQGHYLI